MNPDTKIKIGITGQQGFIGTHLFNFLGLKTDDVIRIPFDDSVFDASEQLCTFVSQCDVIVHLAALNRHHDAQTIFETNIQLVDKLIMSLESTQSTPHVIFASSTQEERDNSFGQSKREGRKKLADWALKNGALFTGLIIPNVYGSFGIPYYNSVVATFCHQLTHGEQPVIENDVELKLIYVQELVDIIWGIIIEKRGDDAFIIPHSIEMKVSDIYDRVREFALQYVQNGIIPQTGSAFDYNLFNSFMNYIDLNRFYPIRHKRNTDERGSFVELMKTMRGGQVSFSTTKPGITRGNHFHTRKIERFSVIKGKAVIRLRRIGSDKIMEFHLDGDEPSYVDIPIWHTHNISNTGDDELYTVFWINEFFNADDPDTFYQEVQV
jgi:UDP-2-acetamido-2,6-beta-L-arabino-hexul-4-ose reductase